MAEIEKQFKAEDLEELRNQFRAFDLDGNGSITVEELQEMMKKLGETTTEQEIQDIIKSVDETGSGTIDWPEFLKFIQETRKGKGGGKFDAVYRKAKKLFRIEGAGGSQHSFTDEEKVAFVNHINSVLDMTIDPDTMDVFEEVKTGVLLCRLINASVPGTIDERVLNKGEKINAWQITENHRLCINSAKAIGCHVVNIGENDLRDGRAHLVLGLLWQIIKIGLLQKINLTAHPELVRLLNDGEELADLLKLPPEKLLIRWVNYHLGQANHPRRVANFSGDIKDSECYTILLSQISHGTCTKEALSMEDPLERAEAVLSNADRIDCRKFVQATDIVKGHPKLNLAFVANLFNTMPALDPISEEEESQFADMLEFDKEGTREERAFRFWIQSLDIEVNNLFEDVRDGGLLLKVFEKIAPGSVDPRRVNKTCRNKFQRVENCNYVIRVAESLRFSLVNIGGTDITDGTRKLVLALVWQMMRFHVLNILKQIGGGKEIEETDLIRWANEKVSSSGKSSSMTSFKDKSIATGIFLIDLCAAVSPRSVNYEVVTAGETDEDREMNAKYAISVARAIGATTFLLWEDIVEVKPKMLMTFVGSLMQVDRQK